MIKYQANGIGIHNVIYYLNRFNILILLLSFLTIEYRILSNKSFSIFDIVIIFLFILFFLIRKINLNFLSVKLIILIIISLTHSVTIFLISNNYNIFFGTIVLIYLCSILFIYEQLAIRMKFEKIFQIFIYAIILNCILSLIGIIFYLININNIMICTNCTSSELLNNFPRIKNLAYSPNSYAFYNFIGILVLCVNQTISNKNFNLFILFLFFILTISLLTLSKTNLLILSFVFIYFFKNKLSLKIIILFFLLIFIFYFVFTNLLLTTKCINNEKDLTIACNFFLDTKILYLQNFITDFKFFGNGYNNYISNIYPHNTIFDLFYSYGITGIIILLYLSFIITSSILSIDNLEIKKLVTFFWLSIIIISINEDIFRYRELWISIAFTYSLSKSQTIND
tara:strand:- start:3425 stop:4615 length:1191 start_codon:yes stop_codon:yes gene_type:complete